MACAGSARCQGRRTPPHGSPKPRPRVHAGREGVTFVPPMAPPPGARQAYHALSLGFYEGEFLRRVDPQHRSLRQFFQDEIAHPPRARFLHPSSRNDPDTRFARLEAPTLLERLRGFPIPLTLAALYPRSNLCRTLVVTRAGCAS